MPKLIVLIAFGLLADVKLQPGDELTPALIKEHALPKKEIKELIDCGALKDEAAANDAERQQARATADVAHQFAQARTKVAEAEALATTLKAPSADAAA